MKHVRLEYEEAVYAIIREAAHQDRTPIRRWVARIAAKHASKRTGMPLPAVATKDEDTALYVEQPAPIQNRRLATALKRAEREGTTPAEAAREIVAIIENAAPLPKVVTSPASVPGSTTETFYLGRTNADTTNQE